MDLKQLVWSLRMFLQIQKNWKPKLVTGNIEMIVSLLELMKI